MLGLDQYDNLGIRYPLSGWLIEDDRDDEAPELINAAEDGTGRWSYQRALLYYRRGGSADPVAGEALDNALALNPLIPQFLLGDRQHPRTQNYSFVDWIAEYQREREPLEQEALDYSDGEGLVAWPDTDGALGWLYDRRGPSGWAKLYRTFTLEGEDPPRAAFRTALENLLWCRAGALGLGCEIYEEDDGIEVVSRVIVEGYPGRVMEFIELLYADSGLGQGDFVVEVGYAGEADELGELADDVRVRPRPEDYFGESASDQ